MKQIIIIFLILLSITLACADSDTTLHQTYTDTMVVDLETVTWPEALEKRERLQPVRKPENQIRPAFEPPITQPAPDILQQRRPRVHGGQVLTQILFGTGGEILFGLGGALIGGVLLQDEIGAFLGFSGGFILGSAIGVYTAGNMNIGRRSYITSRGYGRQRRRGTFAASLGGSLAGFLGGGALFLLTLTGSDAGAATIGGLVLLAAPPICATIAYNMNSRYRSSRYSALINYDKTQMKLAFPAIYLKSLSSTGKRIGSIDIIRVNI